MAETPNQTPKNVAENVLNRTADASQNAFKAAGDLTQKSLDRTADISSAALNAVEKAGDEFKSNIDTAAQSAGASAPLNPGRADDTVAQAGDVASNAANQGARFLGVYSNFGTHTLSIAGDVTRAWTDLFSRQIAATTELSQRALTLRTPQDVIEFQSLASERAQASFAAIREIYGLAFDRLSQVSRQSIDQGQVAA